MANYELEKAVWTDADFEQMGWHDCQVHAIAFDAQNWSLLLDLDYIFKWDEPKPPDQNYGFWIAPVTLKFLNAHSVSADFDIKHLELAIADVHRGKSRETPNGAMTEFLYHLECQEGSLRLWATGFQMIVRREPILKRVQCLELRERGGVSMSLDPVQY